MTHTFIPDVAESQCDIENNAPVYKTPFKSYREPPESELDDSESEDDEPYKEPRESTTLKHQQVSSETSLRLEGADMRRVSIDT